MWEIVNPLHVVGGLAASLLTIWALIVKVWPKVRELWDWMFNSAHKKIYAKLNEVTASLTAITEEITPRNGEGSVRSALNRIEDKVEGLGATQGASLNIHDVAVFKTNAKGAMLSSNREHQMMTGFSIEQLKGSGWINVIAPDQRTWVETRWKQCVAEQREFSEDITYVRPDGKTRYRVHVAVFKEIDSHGRVRGYLGVVTKSCEKELEKALRRSTGVANDAGT